MATQCNFFHYFTYKPCIIKPMSPFASANFASLQETPFSSNFSALELPTPRLNKKVSAVVSQEKVVESSGSGTDDVFKLTYLEGNSWLWEVGGAKILVDPILVGNLDFGIPWLYDAAKKILKNFKLDDLPEIDCILITQSLDDHCHLKTLKPLSQKLQNIRVIATPNAKELLDPLFSNVTYLEPGQDSEIQVSNGSSVKVRATAGPVLGPPWQRPENGYLVTSPKGQLTLYYEPHCVFNENFVEKERADIVITPVIKQLLPNFTLVSGQEDAVRLAKLLHAKFIVPMRNGDLDSKGLLSALVQSEGTIESFKEILLKELPDTKVLEPTPGVPLDVSPLANNNHLLGWSFMPEIATCAPQCLFGGTTQMWRQTTEVTMDQACKCRKNAVMRTSWTDLNPRRLFSICEKDKKDGGCDFFSWIDPPCV